jgi:hypothetical protein
VLDKKGVVVDMKWNRLQLPPGTGTRDTFTGVDHKECSMAGALDHSATAIEKTILLPLQWNPQVGAAIAIDKNLVLLFDHKQLERVLLQALAATIGYFIESTQGDQ